MAKHRYLAPATQRVGNSKITVAPVGRNEKYAKDWHKNK